MIDPAKPSPLPATVEITLPKLGTVPAEMVVFSVPLFDGIVSAAVNDSVNDHVLAQLAGVSQHPFIE